MSEPVTAAGPGAGEDGGGDPGRCRACGDQLVAGARYCEACGTAVDTGARPPDRAAAAAPDAVACARCGAEVGADGYCTGCGLRAPEPVTVENRNCMAFATHRGRRHERNEDAAALTTTREGWAVLIVSDGVSASPNPHLASAAAVVAAAERLGGRPFTGSDDLTAAVAAAHEAACGVPAEGDPLWPSDGTDPACTIALAVVAGETVHLANVGDARGYLLTATGRREAGGSDAGAADGDAEDGGAGDGRDGADAAGGRAGEPGRVWLATQLTTDDSAAARAVAAGAEPSEVLSGPAGHAITAWLGRGAPDLAVHLATRRAAPGDAVLVCSDGLWNYAPATDSLEALLTAELPDPPTVPGAAAAACERLVAWAIAEGGVDNICVALAPVGGGQDANDSTDAQETS